MSVGETLQALKREKVLLENIIRLSERHLRLIKRHQVDGFEAYWPLLGASMAELAEAESAVDFSLTELEKEHVLSWEEQQEIERWTSAIAELAQRLAAIDEETSGYIEIEQFAVSVG
jgi:hypothetical protein